MISFDPAPQSAVPITIVTKDSLASFLSTQPARVGAWLAASGFKGTEHSIALIPAVEGSVERVVVGARALYDLYALSHLPMGLPTGNYTLENSDDAFRYAHTLSWLLGTYQFTRYRKPKPCATLHLPACPASDCAVASFDAIRLTRDLVNTPTEHMGPAELSAVAKEIAGRFGGTFRECVGNDLLTENFPAIHAVGRASHRPPRLIEINWGDPTHPRIAIVGKGVCFDTGGLNIKGADGMRNMKKDMGGSAHAIALAQLIMQAKLPVRLQMLVPAVENAISGNAYRPGEIVATRKGLQIEIGNTDAEGRVVLSDALAYAAESTPQLIIDFATLTGAARVALGPELPATFANDEAWFAKLQTASNDTHDPLWRMPLWQPYQDLIKSKIGDIVNTGGPQAGAVTAALFLQHFLPPEQAWIHIDLFAWNPRARPGRPEGGEAQTLRACFEMLQTAFGLQNHARV